jgi:hypothetical protein
MKKLDKTRMYGLIISVLKSAKNDGLTARECAIKLYNDGKIFDNSRQATAPRLTELENKGIVKLIGKRYDNLTDRMVGVYTLVSQVD